MGKIGRQAVGVLRGPKIVRWLEGMQGRSRSVPLIVFFFFAAFIPLPNEVLAAPLGFLGYRLAHILPIAFAGNLVFNMLYTAGLLRVFGA